MPHIVQALLPATVALHAYLDTPKYDLLATLEINAQLHHIAIVDGERTTLLARTGKADVVKKRA